MNLRLDARRIFSLGLLAALAFALLACMADVPQAEVDSLNRQLQAQQMKVSVLEEQLSNKEKEAAELEQKVGAEETEAAGQPGNGVTVLLGAVLETPPAPGPTPLPAEPPALPASYAEPAAVYIYADTVVGEGSQFGVGCTSDTGKATGAISSIFKRGMRIVYRFEAVDTSTGKRLSDADVQSAIVRLQGGEELQASFGRHGGTDDAPWLWATAWDIPLDYPLGTLDWRVEVVTKDGKTGAFRQFQAYSAERGAESRTQIVE